MMPMPPASPNPCSDRRAAVRIIQVLRRAGHVALLAGGCVRDELLGRTPKDYDVATSALPDQVLAAFPRARAVGKQFGVILVRQFGRDVEVATFRSDVSYTDGRRPDAVTFGSHADDARRRDFTINGMFRDPLDDRVIDTVGGREDLARRLIRTIGDPSQRFGEDHLRMLRAVRLATELDFDVDPATLAAIQTHAGSLERISAERIWMELERLLIHPGRSRGWRLLVQSGLHQHLTTDWSWSDDECDRIVARLSHLPARALPPPPSLAALLRERPASHARRFCGRLKLSNDLTRETVWLVKELPVIRQAAEPRGSTAAAPAPAAVELADLKTWAAHPLRNDLLDLMLAVTESEAGDAQAARRLVEQIRTIPPHRAAPPPLVTGDDLVAAGFQPGPAFKRALHAAYRAQLNETIRTKEEAMSLVTEQLAS